MRVVRSGSGWGRQWYSMGWVAEWSLSQPDTACPCDTRLYHAKKMAFLPNEPSGKDCHALSHDEIGHGTTTSSRYYTFVHSKI